MSNPYEYKPLGNAITNDEPDTKVPASRREQLQTLLQSILGSSNVYFQPPSNVSMQYPAIVYSLSSIQCTAANNIRYQICKAYSITIVSKDPDNSYIDKILELPNSRFDRRYVADNLYHDVITLYF